VRLFIVWDMSLAATTICVVGEHGKNVREAEVASDPEPLRALLQTLDSSIAAVGTEASPLAQWLYRGLTDAGLGAVLMETQQVKGAVKAKPIETDRRDAEGIARLLRLGWFRPGPRQVSFGARGSCHSQRSYGNPPSRNQSGARDVSGGISNAGDVNLRRALCQAATVVMDEEGQKTTRWTVFPTIGCRATWLRSWGAQVYNAKVG
jgi:transposase